MFLPSDHYLKLWKSWPTNLVMNNFKKFKFSIEHLKMFIYFLCRTLRLHLKQILLNNLKCFASSFRNLFECSGTFFKVPQEHSKTFRDNWSWIIYSSKTCSGTCSRTFSMFKNISKSSNWNSGTFCVFTNNFKCSNWTFENVHNFFLKSSHGMFQNVWSNKLLRNI